MQQNMGKKIAAGSMWLATARLIARSVDLITLLVLAQLLLPGDFGVVALAMSLVAVMEAMTVLSIASALIRLPTVTKSFLDTAFTMNLVRGIALACGLAALAVPFVAFYQDERLQGILLALALAPVASSLQSPAMSVLAKNMQFSHWFAIEAASRICALALSASIAFATGSYWAIVAGALVAPVVSTAASYYFAPYKPTLSLREANSMWRFLGWLSLAQLLSALNWQFDRFFLGRVVPMGTLGLYNVSNNIASLPEQSIVHSVVTPLLSGFSTIRDDFVKLRAAYYKSDAVIFTLGLAILLSIAMFADPLVRLLFKDSWLPMVPLLQGLALAFIPGLQRIAFRALAMALNRTELLAQAMGTALALRMLCLIAGYWLYGVVGLIIGIGAASTAMAFVFMFHAKSLIGAPIIEQLGSLVRPICSGCAMAVAGILILPWLNSLDGMGLALGLGIAASAALLAYFAASFGLWITAGRPDGPERQLLGMLDEAMTKLRR